jgi:hypothetical protein
MATIYKGNTSDQEQASSGRRTFRRGAKRQYVKVVRGRLQSVETNAPKVGDTVSIRGKSCVATGVDVQPERGGMATLTVSGVQKRHGADAEITWEIEMAQIEKPLLSHPKYAECAAEVAAWRDGVDAVLHAAHKYIDEDGEEAELTGDALEAAEKIEKGVESYLVFAPVIRKVTKSDDNLTVGLDLGKKVPAPTMPSSISVAGAWEWLKTKDNVTLDGDLLATRIEEWTGADEWDEDLYGSET